jgi:glycosidase
VGQGRQRARYNAVQISGWQRGGHDNRYPYCEPDPRLGTWKELEEGIRACHRMGLKVYFFVNDQPMMVESDWYKRELSKYREMKADGGYTWMAGWGMGTLWARVGHPKLMTWANLAFPPFRKIIVDYFVKLASLQRNPPPHHAARRGRS